jgi:hypothetical protein
VTRWLTGGQFGGEAMSHCILINFLAPVQCIIGYSLISQDMPAEPNWIRPCMLQNTIWCSFWRYTNGLEDEYYYTPTKPRMLTAYSSSFAPA